MNRHPRPPHDKPHLRRTKPEYKFPTANSGGVVVRVTECRDARRTT